MAGQGDKPDFVVDPSGNVYDVRNLEDGFSKAAPARSPSAGNSDHAKPRSSSQAKRVIYVIPIGLIISLVVALIRCLSTPEENLHTFDSESAYSEYSQGNRDFFRGEYDQAIRHYNAALASESDVGDIYNSRGLVYQAKGEHDRALTDFDQALKLMPNSAMVYNNRAITYRVMGDYDQAIADLTKAIELQPNLGKAYYNRGLAYLSLSDFERAIADLDAAIEHSSHWSPIPTLEVHDPGFDLIQGFGEQLDAASHAAPLPSAHYYRGVAHLASGEYPNAIADLRKAIELQPDLTAAHLALARANAAAPQTHSAQAAPEPASMGAGWPTATTLASPPEFEMAGPLEQPPTSLAVYVPQPHETPTTPIWEITQESCDEQRFEMWVSPGRYLYRVTPDGGERYLVAVVQESTETTPSMGQCRLPWLNYGGVSSTGSSKTAPDANKDYRSFCAYDGAKPPGAVTTTGSELETKRISLGTFLTVREDTSHQYHLPYPKYVNDPQGTIATSEWYACGYGLIRSWTSHTGKYQGRDFAKEYGLDLVSFTPLSTSESHVRHILVDAQLSGEVAAYRAEMHDEETAEALRRWDAGVRVANIEEFERTMHDGQWRIVHAETRNPITGSDVILTTDSSR